METIKKRRETTKARRLHVLSVKRWRKRHPVLLMLQLARQRAKRKGLAFSIAKESINIPKTCPILGIELKQSEHHLADNSPSLDRIVPDVGYVAGNVRVISSKANVMKNNASPEELRKFARWVQEEYGN